MEIADVVASYMTSGVSEITLNTYRYQIYKMNWSPVSLVHSLPIEFLPATVLTTSCTIWQN
jgi:hypothetical protein